MRKSVIILVIGLICLGVASCGKRGDLLPPPGYEKPARDS